MTPNKKQSQNLTTRQEEQLDESAEILLALDSDGSESLDDISDADDDDVLKVPKGALLHIYDKLSELEDAIDEVESRQIATQHEFEEELENLAETQTEMRTEIDIVQSRADHISEFAQDIDTRLDSLSESVSDKQIEIDRRLTLLEESKSDENRNNEDIEEITSGSRLARLSRLDQSTIESEFSVDIQRAITIYENYSDWSTTTTAGERLKSGELKKLLNAKTDEDLAWTQLYRAMETFTENTSNSYELVETKTVGKALIKRV